MRLAYIFGPRQAGNMKLGRVGDDNQEPLGTTEGAVIGGTAGAIIGDKSDCSKKDRRRGRC